MSKVILPRTNIVRSFNPMQPTAQRAPASVPPPAATEHSERILLLEDEAQTNFILREYLESLGYHVVAVANGVDGLKEVMKSPFELVICDMMMPKLPGDMFYLAVQKTRPQLCNRFVFITGHGENPAIDAFIERTHSAILVKPFRLQQLEATLESILSRYPKNLQPAAPSAERVPSRISNDATDAPVTSVAKPASMMSKALKMVGFMRNTPPPAAPSIPPPPAAQPPAVHPPAASSVPAVPSNPSTSSAPAARITRRIHTEVKVTRRIAHLANTPLPPPPELPQSREIPAPRVTRRIAAPSVLPPVGSISKNPPPGKTTRRVQTPEEPPATLRVIRPTPESAPVSTPPKSSAPKTTRTIPKTTRTIQRADNLIRVTRKVPAPASVASPATAKTTIKVAAPARAAEPAPKVTRKVAPPAAAKVTQKVSRKIRPSAAAPDPRPPVKKKA